MDLLDAGLLLAAGFAAGVVNALAGGGSLITFPTLVAIGLPPVAANVTNSVAVTPGYLGSVAGSRADLAAVAGRRNLVVLVPTAVIGSVVGCLVLLTTPERAFEVVVPFLVLGAAGLIAFQQRIRASVVRRGGLSNNPSALLLHLTVGLGAIYGGYFGAALGVMLIAALGLVLGESLAHTNALKNAVSALVALVTVVVFGLFGPVNWVAAGGVAATSLVGGYVGARLARWLPPRWLRAFIVTVGGGVGVVLLLHAF